MTDIAVLILFVLTCAVLIEFRPRRLELRRLFEWVQQGQRWLRIQLAILFRRMKDIAGKVRHRPPDAPPQSASRPILAAVLLTLTAIFTSIPASLIAALIFAAGDMLTGAGSLSSADGGEAARYLLGTTFVIWISGLQLAIDQFAITLPVIGLLAYATASLVMRTHRSWATYLGGALLLGAVFPAFYVVASVTGQLGEPIFN